MTLTQVSMQGHRPIQNQQIDLFTHSSNSRAESCVKIAMAALAIFVSLTTFASAGIFTGAIVTVLCAGGLFFLFDSMGHPTRFYMNDPVQDGYPPPGHVVVGGGHGRGAPVGGHVQVGGGHINLPGPVQRGQIPPGVGQHVPVGGGHFPQRGQGGHVPVGGGPFIPPGNNPAQPPGGGHVPVGRH